MIATATSVILMIITLLYVYEISVHYAKHNIPKQLVPVLNVMLAEIAGLGFIGLILQVAEGYFSHTIEAMSEATFGEEEALVEAFEWFHNKFFEVATIFCFFGGGMLAFMVNNIRTLMADIAKADADGDGDVTLLEFKAAFGEKALEDRTFFQMLAAGNLGLSTADSYLFSQRFMEQHKIDKRAFNPIVYVESVGAQNLETLVEVSPFVWFMMLPPLAYMEYMKIKHEIPGDDLAGVAAGIYASSPVLLGFTVLVEVTGLCWAAFNYFKMLSLKRILRPRPETLWGAKGANARLTFGAPKLYDAGAVDEYAKERGVLLGITHTASVVLRCHGKSSHPHHELFGSAGDRGAEVMLLSIKFSTWFCIAAVTFCFTSIVFPDIASISHGTASAAVYTELVVFGTMGTSFLLVLALVIPPTFSMFNVVTSIEGFKVDSAVKKALGMTAEAKHGHH